ncbi:uncharacterized protein LOC134836969 isoform X2 [Culicoides brevitarsis]|uniref:uncharacterized protein LOC134836969 isoform X2 n=1 Tax=Culicoides brevitarsis TaxID=469753 RepID=UPI00307B7478
METRSKARNQHKSLIEKLPVEMLLEIFEYLDSWSIRRCSEVCITFFHLTLRPEFKDFFELTMSDDYLAPNCGIGKIFASGKRTKRTFDHLTLKSVTFETLVFAMIFFTQLGPEVRKVYIDASFFRPIIYKTGTYMTERVFRGNILINFPNLEELRVDAAQTLDKIIFFPPSLKIISVDLAKFGGNVKDYKKFLTDNMGLARLEKLNFIKMMKMHNFDQNNIIIYQHSKISEAVASIIQEIGQYWKIRINCNLLEHSVIEPNCITGLYTENLTQISYNSLKKFPNLKDLSLDLDTSVHCFGSHQLNSDLSHVESLWIAPGRGTKCESCILQMISSFSGLTKLTYHGNLTEHQIRLIFDQLQNLEYLELVGRIPKNILDSSKFTPNSIEQLKNLQALFIVHVSSTLETGISNDCLLKFASLPNLKVLRLSQSHENDLFKIDGIRNLVRQCPKISGFCSTDNAFTGEMVREMLGGWPQLNTLFLPEIIFDKGTWNFVKANCRFLRYLSVFNQKNDQLYDYSSLFKSISSLKIIKMGQAFFTRIEYHHRKLIMKPNLKLDQQTKGAPSVSIEQDYTYEDSFDNISKKFHNENEEYLYLISDEEEDDSEEEDEVFSDDEELSDN